MNIFYSLNKMSVSVSTTRNFRNNGNDSQTDYNENDSKKNLVCPQCNKICLINFTDYKINISGCGNKGHSKDNLLLEEFNNLMKKKI